MFGNEYELIEAAPESDCDYKVVPRNLTDENEDDEYECYEIVDREFGIAVPDTAPAEIFSAVESDGYEAVEMGELHYERVKEVVGYFEERPAYYSEEPPENRFESVPRSNAEDFLDFHDRKYHEVEEAVWYPEKHGAAILYSVVDSAGRVNKHAWERERVSITEREILLRGEDIEDEDEGLTREDIAELIDQNSTIYPREAEIASCWVNDIEDYQQIVRELGPDEVTYQSVCASCYNFRDRQKAVAWNVLHVWQEVPESLLPDEAQEIVDVLDEAGLLENVTDPAFNAPGKGRGKK